MLPLCHLECGNWPLKCYISHLMTDHKLPIYKMEEATMFLELTPPRFFLDPSRSVKLQGLGLLEAFSSTFLIIGLENSSKYWIYAVHLQKTEDDEKKMKNADEFFCSFEIKSPSSERLEKDDKEKDDKEKDSDLYKNLYTFCENGQLAPDTDKFKRIKQKLKLQKYRRMAQLCQPIESGVDKVLSMEEAFSTRFDMGRVFQVSKVLGKLFLVGQKKICVHVKIIKNAPTTTTDLVISEVQDATSTCEKVKKPRKCQYPYQTFLHSDLAEQRKKQDEDAEDDYVAKTVEIEDDDIHVDDKDNANLPPKEHDKKALMRVVNRKKREQLNLDLIEIHQEMVRAMLENEQSQEEVMRNLNYKQNFKADVHAPASVFNHFS